MSIHRHTWKVVCIEQMPGYFAYKKTFTHWECEDASCSKTQVTVTPGVQTDIL